MALEPARLKVLYNLCNPEEAMEQDDQRRADLDARGGRGFLPDDDWATRLSRELQLADAPLFRLISGLPGSGKSTELRRLRDLLQADARGGLLVVLVDAEKALDLRVSIALQDLLVVIVAETERRVVEAEGRSLPGPVQSDTALQRLGARLFGSSASPEKVEVGVGGNKLTLALKPDSSLRSRLERLMKDDAASFLRDVADAMEALQRRAIGAGHQGIVVLVDSLEKLRGMSHNFADVLKSAEDLFGSGAPYLRLPVSAVYTVPVALVLRLSEDVRVLPMIKLRARDGAPFPPGVEAARDLIRRRIPDADLEEIFGAPLEPAIDRLLRASGGYPREIVKLLRAVLTAGTFPLGEERLTRILSESGDAFRRVAHSHGERAIALLARIHLSKRLIVDEEDRQLLDHLLVNNLVLVHQSDGGWADVNPGLLQSGAVCEAVTRARALAEGKRVRAALSKQRERPTLMTGLQKDAGWRDLSDYVVHFTKGGQRTGLESVMTILSARCIRRGPNAFGAARKVDAVRESQRVVCFSEAPIGYLGRLAERRDSHYGLALSKRFLLEHDGAPLWHLEEGTAQHLSLQKLIAEAKRRGPTGKEAIWQLTPFIDIPSTTAGPSRAEAVA